MSTPLRSSFRATYGTAGTRKASYHPTRAAAQRKYDAYALWTSANRRG